MYDSENIPENSSLRKCPSIWELRLTPYYLGRWGKAPLCLATYLSHFREPGQIGNHKSKLATGG